MNYVFHADCSLDVFVDTECERVVERDTVSRGEIFDIVGVHDAETWSWSCKCRAGKGR